MSDLLFWMADNVASWRPFAFVAFAGLFLLATYIAVIGWEHLK